MPATERKLLKSNYLRRGLCSGGLEPRFRVLFSAIFHGVSLGNCHQGGK